MRATRPERTAGYILAGIALTEGVWSLAMALRNGKRFVVYLGFAPGRTGHIGGWIGALIVTLAFVLTSIRFPSVRANLWRPSWLKLLGIAVAVTAGILEEVVFRKLLMDALMTRGFGDLTQIALSALAFGLAHGVWGLLGRSVRAAFGATMATGLLGASLAIVYLAAGRSVAPCVIAHFLINALVEPGLVLAAVRGEMGGVRGAPIR